MKEIILKFIPDSPEDPRSGKIHVEMKGWSPLENPREVSLQQLNILEYVRGQILNALLLYAQRLEIAINDVNRGKNN